MAIAKILREIQKKTLEVNEKGKKSCKIKLPGYLRVVEVLR